MNYIFDLLAIGAAWYFYLSGRRALAALAKAEYARDFAKQASGINDAYVRHLEKMLDAGEAEIARLTPLAEIGLRVEGQPRDENGRFKAKAK